MDIVHIHLKCNSSSVCVNECVRFGLCVSMCVCVHVCRPRDSQTLSHRQSPLLPGSHRGHLSRFTPHSLSGRLIYTVVTKRKKPASQRHGGPALRRSELRGKKINQRRRLTRRTRLASGLATRWVVIVWECGFSPVFTTRDRNSTRGMNLRLQPQ